jgi:hypothetical protein
MIYIINVNKINIVNTRNNYLSYKFIIMFIIINIIIKIQNNMKSKLIL